MKYHTLNCIVELKITFMMMEARYYQKERDIVSLLAEKNANWN